MCCPYCNKQIPDGSKFCPECGAPLPQQTTIATAIPSNNTRNKPRCPECGSILSKNGECLRCKSGRSKGVPFIVWIILGALCLYLAWPFLQVFFPEFFTKTSTKVINPINVEYSGCRIKYLRHKIEKDSNPRLFVYYRFENNDSEGNTHTFDYLVNQAAYQNGIELDRQIFFNDDKAIDDSDTSIRPGVAITVCTCFHLRNIKSPVKLTMSTDSLFFSKDLGTMTIPIT